MRRRTELRPFVPLGESVLQIVVPMRLVLMRVLLLTIASLCTHVWSTAQFTEVSSDLGVDHIHVSLLLMGGGAAFADINGDGFDDLFLTGGEASDRLYLNREGRRFDDVSERIPYQIGGKSFISFGVVAGDINNDGCPDLFITTQSAAPNRLLLNDCNGFFEDITINAGILDADWSISATLIDYNGDGWLDIYVGNYIETAAFLRDDENEIIGFDHICYPNYLYRNNGDLTFTEVGKNEKADDTGCNLATAALDYNEDGLVDLYNANDFGEWVIPNVLLTRTSTNSVFTDCAPKTGSDAPIYGMGIAIGDYDRDLDYDLYVTNLGRNVMLRREGDGFSDEATSTYTENTFANGDSLYATGWGACFLDYDHDGYEDLFVANGYIPSAAFLPTSYQDPNKLYRNLGDGTFEDVSGDYGVDAPSINRGMAMADWDNDGDMDIVVPSLSDMGVSGARSWFYENEQDSEASWMEITLEGTVSNRDGIGADVRIYCGGDAFARHRFGGGSHASSHARRLHLGLGNHALVDSLIVRWPSGIRQHFSNIDVNRHIWIVEGTDTVDIVGCTDPTFENFDPMATRNGGCAGVRSATEDVDKIKAIRLFPTLTTDRFYIQSSQTIPHAELRVYDAIGCRTLSRTVSLTSNAAIAQETRHWNAGLYVVRLIDPSGRVLFNSRCIVL